MNEKRVFILYCFNMFVPILSWVFFCLCTPNRVTAMEWLARIPFLMNGLVYTTFALCCIVAIMSVAVFVLGNIHQKIGSIVSFILALLYVGLWINIYYTFA